jgi:hypothetical protein
VDAVLHLVLGEQAGRNAGGVPTVGDHQQIQADPQIARDDFHDLRLAAVAVEQHELSHAGARHRFAELRPQPDQSLGR